MSSDDFAHAFGTALQKFLQEEGVTQSDAAGRLGLSKAGRARINTYCHGSSKGTRPNPSAEILYLVCTKLGFTFEYNGYKISAATVNGHAKSAEKTAEQLPLALDRQFDLTDQKGAVSVTVKQPPGRVEVSLSLKAAL